MNTIDDSVQGEKPELWVVKYEHYSLGQTGDYDECIWLERGGERLISEGDFTDQDLQKIADILNAELEAKSSPLEKSEKPKVVCFCGSTRFAAHFMVERWKLEKQGIITLGINILPDGYFPKENHHGAEQEGVKHILDDLHLRKIDIADTVVILNVDGYIGESTRRELEYALSIGKPVIYLEDIVKIKNL